MVHVPLTTVSSPVRAFTPALNPMRDLPRIPLPTTATTAQIARLPSPIRRAALLSARVERVEPLVNAGNALKGILDGKKGIAEAKRDLTLLLRQQGYAPDPSKKGGLQDLTSERRQNLIFEMNIRKARGYAKRAADMDPDTLDLWPAQELVRHFERKGKRDWAQRWTEAGGTLYQGRMVAIKTAPIWRSISRFDEPYPPFDFGSGMGLEDTPRDEAVSIGVMGEDDTQTPEEPEFPEVEEANLPGIAQMPALRAAVEKSMGDNAAFVGDRLVIRDLAPPVGKTAPLSDSAIAKSPKTIPNAEARALVERGQAKAKAPDGTVERITEETLAHWGSENSPKRLIREPTIRHALDAIAEPDETWNDWGIEKKTKKPVLKTFYLKTTARPDGNHDRTYVVSYGGRVRTWVTDTPPGTNENKRKGTLEYKAGH